MGSNSIIPNCPRHCRRLSNPEVTMIRPTKILFALLLLLAFSVAQEKDPRYQQLLQAEAAWDEADANHDAKALAEILAPEFVTIHEDGSISTFEEGLKGASAQAVHAG